MACSKCGTDLPAAAGRCTVCGNPEAAPSLVGTGVLTPPPFEVLTVADRQLDAMSADAAATVLSTRGAAPAGPLFVGQSFGERYHILRLLGTGGMGAVYQAWDQELAVAVALKVIRPEVLRDPAAAADLERRFKRELLLARQVTHKNVVRIHDLGEIDGVKYITMPYVEGADLATVLKREGTLPVSRACNLARQIVAGLAAAHESGVIHRDLKPANVMIGPNDQALIMDFGIARSASGTGGGTVLGGVVGTLEYMAPEQARGVPVDHRVDIYAFGLILYDMLVGRRHGSGGESAVVELMNRMQHALQPVRAVDPTIPEFLERVIDRCIQPNPAERYATTEALAADLAAAATAMESPRDTIASERPALMRPRLRRRAAQRALVVTCVALLTGIASWWSIQPNRVHTPSGSSSAPANSTDAGAGNARKLIAVMPFELRPKSEGWEHVATGLTEALRGKLFHVTGVGIATGDAVERARGRPSLNDVGRELGVETIVTGTVGVADERLEIVVDIHSLATNSRTWTRTYSGVPEDLLTLEDQIYSGLLGAMNLAPHSSDVARAIAHPTENYEAYEQYLKGLNALRGEDDPRNVRKAIALFEEALKRDTGFALAYTGIANGALRMYRFTKDAAWTSRALSAAQQAQRLDESLVEVHLALGGVYQATGRTAESVAELRRATELAPNSDDAYRRLARAYLASGREAEALQAYEKAISINPYYWINYNTLGAAFLRLGEPDKAIRAFEKVIELEPTNVNGHNDLGAAYLLTGEFARAAGAFQKALELLPNPETYTNVGISFYYVGKFAEAVPMFEKAVELAPNSEQFVGNLADGYRWSGQKEKSANAYERAIRLALKELRINPKNAAVRGNLGLYYAKSGDIGRGERFIRDARSIDAANVNLIYGEATVHALAGRHDDALRLLEEACAAGYPIAFARNDPELRTVHTRPAFEAILKRLEPKRSQPT